MNDDITILTYKGYADGSAEFYGASVERVTGYTPAEFVSDRSLWPKLVHPDDASNNKSVFIKALKGSKVYTREYRIIDKKGDLHWLKEFSQIILDDKGRIDFVIGSALDITQMKKEEELRAKRERLTGKYQFFSLHDQEYGIGIIKVREIIKTIPITPIPQAPYFMKGVINLRGKIIPIIDLRMKLGFPEVLPSDHSCIIIVEVKHNDSYLVMGTMVDSVSEVMTVNSVDIEDPPLVISGYIDYVLGMAKIGGGVRILIDIDKLLDSIDIDLKAASTGRS